jgi:hypothetical protein
MKRRTCGGSKAHSLIYNVKVLLAYLLNLFLLCKTYLYNIISGSDTNEAEGEGEGGGEGGGGGGEGEGGDEDDEGEEEDEEGHGSDGSDGSDAAGGSCDEYVPADKGDIVKADSAFNELLQISREVVVVKRRHLLHALEEEEEEEEEEEDDDDDDNALIFISDYAGLAFTCGRLGKWSLILGCGDGETDNTASCPTIQELKDFVTSHPELEECTLSIGCAANMPLTIVRLLAIRFDDVSPFAGLSYRCYRLGNVLDTLPGKLFTKWNRRGMLR